MSDLAFMLKQALQAQQRAYAPYSNFQVGACIMSASQQYFSGCNVENAAYGLTACAEGNAIAAMVNAGETQIKEIVIVGGKATEICPPCGACRQRIREFAALDALIHLCDSQGLRKTMTLQELLPESFGPQQLELAAQ